MDFSLKKLQLSKLSQPSSGNKENKMVDIQSKKSSNYQTENNTQMKRYLNNAKRETRRIGKYLQSTSKKLSKDYHTRSASGFANYSRRKVKPSVMKSSKSSL